MAIKIEIIGSALVCTDTVNGLILISQPSKDIWYKEKDLQDLARISFYDSNGIQGNAIYSKELPTIQLSDAVDSNLSGFTEVSFREFATNFLGYDAGSSSASSLANLGWAQYKDTQYTSVSPLVVAEGTTVNLNNNAGSVINAHLPIGVTQLYDAVTKKILPVKLGDAILIRINFKCYTDNNNGLADLKVDIGQAEPILERDVQFPKGTGALNLRKYSTTNLFYQLNDFVTNGGDVLLESITGATTIYDIVYIISVVNKGK